MKSYKLSPISGEIVSADPGSAQNDPKATTPQSGMADQGSAFPLASQSQASSYGDFTPRATPSARADTLRENDKAQNVARYNNGGIWTVKTVAKATPSTFAPQSSVNERKASAFGRTSTDAKANPIGYTSTDAKANAIGYTSNDAKANPIGYTSNDTKTNAIASTSNDAKANAIGYTSTDAKANAIGYTSNDAKANVFGHTSGNRQNGVVSDIPIPPTAPSRQSVPRVPNRAHTEMSVATPEQMQTNTPKSEQNGSSTDQGAPKSKESVDLGDESIGSYRASTTPANTLNDRSNAKSGAINSTKSAKKSNTDEYFEKLRSNDFTYDDCDINDVDPEIEELTRNQTNGEIGTIGTGNKKRPVSEPKDSKFPVTGAMIEGFSGDSNDENEAHDDQTSAPKTPKTTQHDKTVTIKSGQKLIKTIIIAGQIEGHTQLPQGQKATRYEELIPQLVEIEEDDQIGGLLLILNTVGGDVEAGLALSELIAGMKKPTASLVLGGGHSIGVPLAVSTDRSFIVPSATMTLHPVRITGMILGAPQTYVYLSRMQERIIDFTCSHCSMSPKRFNELMLSRDEMSTDLGSVLDGKQAVAEGLIDSLGALSDALNFLKEHLDQN